MSNKKREKLIKLLTNAELGYAQYLFEESDEAIKGADIEKHLMKRLEFYADYLLKHNIESIINEKDNVLQLRKEKFPLLFSKKKTSTCRQGIRHIDINDDLTFVMTEDKTFTIDVTVTDVKYIKYNELTEEEAIKEGYTSLKELQDTLKTLYTINDNDDFTIIEFIL